jgi:hypothetical protein
MYAEALEVFRRPREARADGDARLPQRRDRFRAERGSRRAFDDLTRNREQLAPLTPVTGRLAEHIPELALHSSGGIHRAMARGGC